MPYKTYHSFLAEQERTYDFVKLGMDGKGFDNHVFLQALNSSLAKTCSHTFITPYIALGSISRVLAYGRIIIPQVQILDKEKGTIVFDCHQFGDIHGKNLDGSVATSDNDFLGQPTSKYFIFFSYHMEPDGFYDCFAKIVDGVELGALMSGQEDIDDDNRLHEVSKPKLERYIQANKKDRPNHPFNDRKQHFRDDGERLARRKIGGHKVKVHATEEQDDDNRLHEGELNEISKKTAKSYITKASVEIDHHMNKLYDKHGKGWTTKGKGSADHRKLNNREKGWSRALDKASKSPGVKVHATEEQDDANDQRFPQYHKDLPPYTRRLAIEEPTTVTEVSKGLLQRYIKKAHKSHSDIHQTIQKLPNTPAHDAHAEKLTNKATRRSDSIDLADRKIGPKTKVHATEEPINELSGSTLYRYRKAANLDSIKAYNSQRKSHSSAEKKQLQTRIDHRARGIHIARAKSTMQRGAKVQATVKNEEPVGGLYTGSGSQSTGKQIQEKKIR